MSGTLRNFWKKAPAPVGAAVKASINGGSTVKQLKGVTGAGNIAGLVSAYENIDPANDPDCSLRMTALRNLDQEIYSWFANNPAPSLADQKGAAAMQKLMRKSEAAHEQLVEATKDDLNVVPFDTSNLSQQEVTDRTAVWRSLVGNTGGMKLEGSDKFQKGTRAKYAKMLQTQRGFDILDYLNTTQNDPADDEERIVVSDKIPPHVGNIQHIKDEHQNVSYANDLSADRSRKEMNSGLVPTGNEDPNEYPTLTSSDEIQKAIFEKRKGFILGGKLSKFGPGSGAFVTTVPPKAGDEHSDTAGPNNTQIPTPSFITLGHELGHAVNMRGGATTRIDTDLMTSICQNQDPNATAAQVTDQWSNSEEYLVINNVENGLRRENGIPERISHKDLTVLKKMADIKQIDARAGQLSSRDRAANQIPAVESFAQWFAEKKKKIDDPKVLAQIKKRLERVEKLVSDGYIEKFKIEDLHKRFDVLQALYAKNKAYLQPDDDDEDGLADHVEKYRKMTLIMSDKGTVAMICKVGGPGYQNMCDDIRNARRVFDAAAPTPVPVT